MKRKLILLTLGIFLYGNFVFAQGDEVPKPVKETFTNQYPNAENVEYQDNPLNVWVNFTVSGEKMKANYTRKGQWKNTEKEWTFEQLPEAVKDGFHKSKYVSWEIEETKIIYRAGGTERYRVKVKKNGLQKKYLYFNQDGQLVEDTLTL
jgi:hypothetical protein